MTKNALLYSLTLTAVLSLSGCGGGGAPAGDPVGKKAITAMSKKGASEAEIISAVEKNPGPYVLNEDDVIELHKDGVSDNVVIAMLRHDRR
jgi:hypothetical protein